MINSIRQLLSKYISHLSIEIFLKILSLLALLSIFLKASIDIDPSWDTWNYHLPFAARIWGIISKEEYAFENLMEYRYQGFPLLAPALQGFFWFVSHHIQSTNLVSFFSLIIYVQFTKRYLQIPFYLSTIAILSVPLIQIHSTSSYTDLTANIFTSIFLILVYKQCKHLLYTDSFEIDFKGFLATLAVAGVASNVKFQMIPIIFIFLIFYIFTLAYKYILFSQKDAYKLNENRYILKLKLCVISAILLLPLIFFTPTKNIIFYQNPFYPVQVELLGNSLNYKEKTYRHSPEYMKNEPQFKRWIFSILEINAYDKRRPLLWTVDQGDVSLDSPSFRMGGYFGAYVIFHLCLLLYVLNIKNCVDKAYTFIFFLVLSIITSVMPQSHELRYYMYWMIILISLNLHLIVLEGSSKAQEATVILDQKKLALITIFAFFVVSASTQFSYLIPRFFTLSSLQKNLDTKILEEIKSTGEKRFCLVGKQPYSFLYASYFYERDKYYIKSTYNDKTDGCRNARILH